MLLLRSLVFDAWLYVSMLVMGVVLAPVAIASRDGAIWAMKLYCRQALWMLNAICGLKTEIRGAPPVAAAVVAAKHQSFLDVMMMMLVLERPRFVMKRQLAYAPVFGLYALRIGAEPIDRSRGGAAIRRLKRLTRNAADAQLVIYPQGTRLPPDAIAPYRRGVAVVYGAMNAPCHPVATNAGVFWSRRSLYRRPGLAVLEFLAPIGPGLATAEFMATLENRVEDASSALLNQARARREAPASAR